MLTAYTNFFSSTGTMFKLNFITGIHWETTLKHISLSSVSLSVLLDRPKVCLPSPGQKL